MNEALVIGVLILLIGSRCIPMLILEGYMWRWHLVPHNKLFNIYLHVFIDSDERTFHDHPWDSWSLCLWGRMCEYWQLGHTSWIVPDDLYVARRDIGMGQIVKRGAEHRHYLKLLSKFSVTLFCTGPLRADGVWYFYPADGERVPSWGWPQAFKAWRWSWKHLTYRSA